MFRGYPVFMSCLGIEVNISSGRVRRYDPPQDDATAVPVRFSGIAIEMMRPLGSNGEQKSAVIALTIGAIRDTNATAISSCKPNELAPSADTSNRWDAS